MSRVFPDSSLMAAYALRVKPILAFGEDRANEGEREAR